MIPTVGAVSMSMLASGQCWVLYQSKYDWGVSKTMDGATGCHMA
jgi:hypothetical protein